MIKNIDFLILSFEIFCNETLKRRGKTWIIYKKNTFQNVSWLQLINGNTYYLRKKIKKHVCRTKLHLNQLNTYYTILKFSWLFLFACNCKEISTAIRQQTKKKYPKTINNVINSKPVYVQNSKKKHRHGRFVLWNTFLPWLQKSCFVRWLWTVLWSKLQIFRKRLIKKKLFVPFL